MSDKQITIVLSVALIACLIVVFAFINYRDNECKKRGGVLIRGVLSYECIAKGNLK